MIIIDRYTDKTILDMIRYLNCNVILVTSEKTKITEFKILFSYIVNYEDKCIDSDCYLKRFLKIQFKQENF